MKSTRPKVSSHIKASHWLKPSLLKQEIAAAESKANVGNLEAIFYWLTYFNWGFPPSECGCETMLERAKNGIPANFSEECSPELTVGYGTTFQLLCSLLRDGTTLRTFSDGVDMKSHQTFGADIDIQPIFFRIVNLSRRKPFKDFKKVDDVCVKARVKVFAKLIDAIDGIQLGKQEIVFELLLDAIAEHVKRLKVRMAKEPVTREDLIARCHSTLWNIAVQKGMNAPSLPEEFSPFMLTRSTLELD